MAYSDEPELEPREEETQGQPHVLSPAEVGVFATIALLPLAFIWLFLSLLGLKSELWFLLFALPLVLLPRLYPLYLRSRSGEPLEIGRGIKAAGKSKRDLLVIGGVVIVAYYLVRIVGSEIRDWGW